jgi:3-dehydroquinate dehydratase-1
MMDAASGQEKKMHHSKNRRRPAVQVVGVIASPIDLARATRLRFPPDFFELRLDALRHSLGAIRRALPRLRAPLILTARHPAEGGRGRLTPLARRRLLKGFLDHAALIDLELRSAKHMQPLLAEMRRREIGLIVSLHNLRSTPALDELILLTRQAAEFDPAFIKIATRTDTPAQLDRLLSFVRYARGSVPLAAMGMGNLGRKSRHALNELGSALTYVSLGQATVPGQLSLSELRRARRA